MKKKGYEVVRLGHPALRMRSERVDPKKITTPQFQELLDRMIQTMRDYRGVGLAAPQIGLVQRIFCVESKVNKRYPGMPNVPVYVAINPIVTILEREKVSGIYEGCLSIPGLRGWVDRPTKVRLKALDRNGESIDFVARGFHARILQHEYDHLNGKVYIDRVKDKTSLCFEDYL